MKLPRVRFTIRRMIAVAAVMLPPVCGCSSLEEYPDPGSVFQATFNVPPGPGVTILQAYGRAFGDNASCYLRLKATPAAFMALTSVGFTPITRREYRERIQGGGIVGPLPKWWNPLADNPSVFLSSGSFHPGYREGQSVVAYNPETQITTFYWDGND
jgi:hypothetical protein